MDRFEPYTLFRTSHCTTVLGNPGYLPRRILALGRVVTVAGCNIECSAPLPSSVSLVNHRSPDTTPVAMHGPGYAAERPSMTHSRLEVIVAWILAAYSKTEVGDSSEAALQTDRHSPIPALYRAVAAENSPSESSFQLCFRSTAHIC